MIGKGMAHGAATIVNAIATGRGAAFGVDLKTWAEVELDESGDIEVVIEGFSDEDTRLAQLCVIRVLERFAEGGKTGGVVRTRSEIPVSRGLKSSSAAANAIILATLNALQVKLDPLDAVRIGTRCAIEAGVSITGAFDDACASMFGGIVITDNAKERIEKQAKLPNDIKVVIHVPSFQIRKKTLPMERIKTLRPLVDMAYGKALDGLYWEAMLLNGLCYSAALELKHDATFKALQHGALAAGLSGTGPATAIVVEKKALDGLLAAFKGSERLIITDGFNGEV
jgi:shikimate kinase